MTLSRVWLAAALLAAACSPAPYVLNPAYADARFEGRTVRLLPICDLIVDNLNDFDDDFQGKGGKAYGEPEAVLGTLFNVKLAGLADHARPLFDSAFAVPAAGFRDTVLEIPGKHGVSEKQFGFPSAQALRDAGSDPDLALQLQDLRFDRNGSQNPPGFMVPGPPIRTPAGSVPGPMMPAGGGSIQYLELTGYFILWDYRAEAPVAYGRFHSISVFSYFMDDYDWRNVIEQAAESVVEHTPLKGPKLAKARAPEETHGY